MTSWHFYWILKLDTIRDVFIVISMLNVLVIIISSITFLVWKNRVPIYIREGTEDHPSKYFIELKKLISKTAYRSLILCIILFSFVFPAAVLLPTTKQTCVIYLLPQMTNNKSIQEIPNNFSKLINEKLEQWLDDVRDIKKKTHE